VEITMTLSILDDKLPYGKTQKNAKYIEWKFPIFGKI
jgi:hypothetical protein